jgi:hypothetical protein
MHRLYFGNRILVKKRNECKRAVWYFSCGDLNNFPWQKNQPVKKRLKKINAKEMVEKSD